MSFKIYNKQCSIQRRQSATKRTRKLCWRKDDRAMRPIWCPENVHDSL